MAKAKGKTAAAAAAAAAAKKAAASARRGSGRTKQTKQTAANAEKVKALKKAVIAAARKGTAAAAASAGSAAKKTTASKPKRFAAAQPQIRFTLPAASPAGSAAASLPKPAPPKTAAARFKAASPRLSAAAQSVLAAGADPARAAADALAKAENASYLPVSGFRVSSRFGVDRGTHRHSGIDLAVPEGTKVAAARKGTVTFAGWGNGYGYRVVIDHGAGTETTYNHLSDIGVSVGDTVRAGSAIALSGNTGHSTGPHLHFEVRVNGRYVNPESYFDFGGGLTAKDSGVYTSKLRGNRRSGSASGSAAKKSAKTKKKGRSSAPSAKKAASAAKTKAAARAAVATVQTASPTASPAASALSFQSDAQRPSLPEAVPFIPADYRGVNYFASDLNPLLELIPAYRSRRTRSRRR